jgi:Flp pilus assembly protein TadG
MKLNHAEKGQSLVELALTLLIILTLLAGAVDLGSAFFSYVAIRDAAQEGALYGSLYPTDTNGIYYRVRQSSSAPVNLSDISIVTVPPPSTPQGACRPLSGSNPITVTVRYNYELSMPFIGAILGTDKIPLSASVTDTILNPKCP